MNDIVNILDGSKIDDYIALALAIIGFASVLVQLLEKIAKITPNTKDDEYVSVIKKYLGYAASILNWLALNLPKSTARVDKKAAVIDAAKIATVNAAQSVLNKAAVTQDHDVAQVANEAIDALQYGKELIKKDTPAAGEVSKE